MPRRWCLPRVKSPNSALPVAVLVPLGQLQPIGGQRNSYTSVRIIKHLQTTPSPARPPSVASRRVDARRDACTADSTGRMRERTRVPYYYYPAPAARDGRSCMEPGFQVHAEKPIFRSRRADGHGHGHGPGPVSCARATSHRLRATATHGDAAQILQVPTPRRRCVCAVPRSDRRLGPGAGEIWACMHDHDPGPG